MQEIFNKEIEERSQNADIENKYDLHGTDIDLQNYIFAVQSEIDALKK